MSSAYNPCNLHWPLRFQQKLSPVVETAADYLHTHSNVTLPLSNVTLPLSNVTLPLRMPFLFRPEHSSLLLPARQWTPPLQCVPSASTSSGVWSVRRPRSCNCAGPVAGGNLLWQPPTGNPWRTSGGFPWPSGKMPCTRTWPVCRTN